jgi:signal transduction histidine kinase
VVLEVQDTCGGIRRDDLLRVFEPGFRGDTSRRADGRGFGLGLTIAHWQAARHQGRAQRPQPRRRVSLLAAIPSATTTSTVVHGGETGSTD